MLTGGYKIVCNGEHSLVWSFLFEKMLAKNVEACYNRGYPGYGSFSTMEDFNCSVSCAGSSEESGRAS